MKKIWKSSLLLGAVAPLAGMSSLMIVSCGHKNSTMTWSEFKAAATKEKAINIVNAIMPPAWKGATATQLSLGKFQVDDKGEIINVMITRTVTAADISSGTFQISYNAQNYDVNNWVTTKKPSDDPDWSRFVNKAKAETADTLLSYAKTSATWATLKWMGTTAQETWQTNDKAEFDVYGGTNHASDPKDVVDVMKGSITADNNAKTITAIISRVGHEGLYDSDPIKAVITFKDDIYNNANWVFSKDNQLQSYMKYKLLIDPVETQISNASTKPADWSAWISSNWVSTKHSTDTTILNWLTNNKRGTKLIGPGSTGTSNDPSDLANGKRNQMKFYTSENYLGGKKDMPYIVKTDFIYASPAKDGISPIGNAFNYSWVITKGAIPPKQ